MQKVLILVVEFQEKRSINDFYNPFAEQKVDFLILNYKAKHLNIHMYTIVYGNNNKIKS